MTTAPTACPPWCDEGENCRGEHTSKGIYLPTTGGLPDVHWQTGTAFPVVGVTLSHDTVDGLAPCVDVHISGRGSDADASLLVPEARSLARAILDACELVEGTR